ncbi:MAG: rhombosortase, partial [Proteobacteria bacterium]
MTTLAKSLNGDGRYGLVLLLIVLALLALAIGGDAVRDGLEWRRSALADGQWWRLATGHLVHLDLTHAALNAVGLVLVWALYARAWSPGQWLAIVGVVVASIDAGLWVFVPSLHWYVGASGLLHGLIVAGLVSQLRHERGVAIVVGALLLAKIVY